MLEKSGLWHRSELGDLQPVEAYDAMCLFLEAYWERGGRSSDDIAILLGMICRNKGADLPPIDIAQWDDWLQAVKAVKDVAEMRKN